MVSACRKHDDGALYWQMEQEKTGLAQRLALLHYRQNLIPSGTVDELECAKEKIAKLEQKSSKMTEIRHGLVDQIRAMEEAMPGLARQWLENKKTSAIGRKFARFELLDGRVFEDVTIVGVKDSGVSIRHAQGAATLRFGDLSKAQRDEFGLEAEASMAAERQEGKQMTAYHQWVDQRMSEMEDEKSHARMVADLKEREERAVRAFLFAREQAKWNDRPLARAARPVGSTWPHRWYESDYHRYDHRWLRSRAYDYDVPPHESWNVYGSGYPR